MRSFSHAKSSSATREVTSNNASWSLDRSNPVGGDFHDWEKENVSRSVPDLSANLNLTGRIAFIFPI